MNKSKTLKYCATCNYYGVYTEVCYNDDSEHVGDFMGMIDTCEAWEEITDEEDKQDEV